MFSIIYNIYETVKYALTGEYSFITPVNKSNKSFWKGVSFDLREGIKCVLHLKTKLLISYDGKLLGRYINNEIVYLEDLDPKIIKWYNDCGFDIEQV